MICRRKLCLNKNQDKPLEYVQLSYVEFDATLA